MKSPEWLPDAIEEYKGGATLLDLQRKYHKNHTTISRHLKKAGVRIRTRAESARINGAKREAFHATALGGHRLNHTPVEGRIQTHDQFLEWAKAFSHG